MPCGYGHVIFFCASMFLMVAMIGVRNRGEEVYKNEEGEKIEKSKEEVFEKN